MSSLNFSTAFFLENILGLNKKKINYIFFTEGDLKIEKKLDFILFFFTLTLKKIKQLKYLSVYLISFSPLKCFKPFKFFR